MDCRECGGRNRDGARFCSFCGTATVVKCAACGTDLLDGARFCDSCGTPVVEAAAEPVAAARKVVTVLFADMTGSTSLEEELDAESVRSLVDRFYPVLRAEVEKRAGRVVKFTGDGVMAAFGIPEVREDDAARAVETALAMCTACERLAHEMGYASLSLKVGVNTGEVVVIEDDDDVVGDAVNVAARLEGAAEAGTVLVGEGTWRLTRATSRYEPVEPLTLKGKAEPVPAYRLVSVDESGAEGIAAPFVGRDAELDELVAVFDEAVAANAARLVTIIGSPGLGKTRLTRELALRLADRAVVRETRCDPASATLAPIAEALRAANEIPDAADEDEILAALLSRLPEDEPDRERIARRAAAVLGAGEPGSTEETFWALRRMIEIPSARELPRVIVLDDLHWAEPLLLDLVEHLAEWTRDAPVLLVGTGRPEIRDIRPSLVEGGRATAVIALEGLDEHATQQLAVGLLGTETFPRELLAKIPASTEGNPLFVRELVRMLVDDGVLRRDGEAWNVTVDVDAIEVPPTIQSLLAARMDRLRADERSVVELASVVGKEFYRGAILELAPAAVREQLDTCLESLRRKELVEPAGTYWIDEPVYRFHHALIRDAAYRRLLKESRADVHERVGEWLQRKTNDIIGEHEELIGYHFEQAHEYLRQLGKLDEHAQVLGGRAAELLGAAAKRALDRDDLPSAATLSGRALARVASDDPARSELLLIRCEALLSMGDVSTGARTVAELQALAATPRLTAWATCFAGQLANYTEPEHLHETEKRVAAAGAELASLGDPAGAAKAHTVHGSTLARLGRFAECESALDAALTAAREASDRRRITAVLGSAPLAALWGPNPVSRAGGRCLDLVRLSRITTGSPGVEVTSTRCQAVLEAFRGRSDAARKMLRNARSTLEELGLRYELLETQQFSGIVELVAGDAAAAESHLRAAHDGFRVVGVDVLAAQTAALLARAHLRLGEIAEAERYAEESELLGGQDLQASIAWRAVRAEILARRGEFDEARALAESAIEIASRTDALIDHGDACTALAAVCRAAGDDAGARSAQERAFALYERKGATALLEELAHPLPPAEQSSSPAAPALENQCTRLVARLSALFAGRDWERCAALFAEGVTHDDLRSLISQPANGRAETLAVLRSAADIGTVSITWEPIATRGECLALFRTIMRGRELGAAPFGMELLHVIELDEHGRVCASVTLDEDALDGALAELDERYIRGEGAGTFYAFAAEGLRSLNARDWDGLRSRIPDDFVLVDRRPASLGQTDVDGYIAASSGLVELIPNIRWTTETVYGACPEGVVLRQVGRGLTIEGNPTSLEFIQVLVIRQNGELRFEFFPSDDVDAALARFGELTQTTAPPPALELDNRSVVAMRALSGRFEQRDWSGIAELMSDDTEFIDHRLLFRGRSSGRDVWVQGLKVVAEVGTTHVRVTPLAVRGERLGLARTEFEGPNVGSTPFGSTTLTLFEVGQDDRIRRVDLFEGDDLSSSMDELDERFLQGEAADHADVWNHFVLLYRELNARDWGAARARCADDLELIDHRPASLGNLSGADQVLETGKTMSEVVPDLRWIIREAVRLTECGVLARILMAGTNQGGGPMELEFLVVFLVEAGRTARLEIFPVEHVVAALARFEELSQARPTLPLENACTRALARMARTVRAADWDSAPEHFAPSFLRADRRSGLRDEADAAQSVGSMRSMKQLGLHNMTSSTVAIRGDHLALLKVTFEDEHSNRIDVLCVYEVDEEERLVHSIIFDPDDLVAALEELDVRFSAGEGAYYGRMREIFRLAFDRDWEALRGRMTDDFVFVDHRPVSLGQIQGGDELIEALRPLRELVPDLIGYVPVIHALAPDRAALEILVQGSGPDVDLVEIALQVAFRVRDGRLARLEFFGEQEVDAAIECFEELGRATVRLENECTRVSARMLTALERRQWGVIGDLYSEDAVSRDTRPGLAHQSAGRQAQVDRLKALIDVGGAAQLDVSTIAVRGQRLGLFEQRWHRADPRDPDFEVVLLMLRELDDEGRIALSICFGSDDLDAAFAELEDRYVAGEGAPFEDLVRTAEAVRTALRARDWDAMRGRLADDFQFVDHRPMSLGQLDRDGWVDSWRVLAGVSADVRSQVVAYRAIDRNRVILDVRLWGSNFDHGSVEVAFLSVHEARDGRWLSSDVFPHNEIEMAFARFEEFGRRAESRLENASARVAARFPDLFNRRDWEGIAAMYADEVSFEDRRTGLGAAVLGRDAQIDQLKVMADLGSRQAPTGVLAVRGDKLVLFGSLWTVSAGDGTTSEIETLFVHEIDADERMCALVVFDPDDQDAAFEDLDTRYLSDIGAPLSARLAVEMMKAYNSRDWGGLRNLFGPDLVSVDRLSPGRTIVGPDNAVQSMRELVDLAPDLRLRVIESIAVADPVALGHMRQIGTAEHGGAVEFDYLSLGVVGDHGRYRRIEIFAAEDRARAVAVFEELKQSLTLAAKDARTDPSNQSVRVFRRVLECFERRDWDELAGLYSPTFVVEDRRAGLGNEARGREGSLEGWMAAAEVGAERVRATTIATRGETLSLTKVGFYGDDAAPDAFAVELVFLNELGGDGTIVHALLLDADDVHVALAELNQRYINGEGRPFAGLLRLGGQAVDALNARDWRTFESAFAPDLVHVDHRSASFGEVHGRDELLRIIKELAEMVPDLRHWISRFHAIGPTCALAEWSVQGTNVEGGVFEMAYHQISCIRNRQMVRNERFSTDQLDAALARFEELTTAGVPGSTTARLPAGGPQNACTRLMVRYADLLERNDWSALGDLMSPESFSDDRRRGLGSVVRGRKARIEGLKAWAGIGGRHVKYTPIATRGERLALIHAEWSTSDSSDAAFGAQYAAIQELDSDGRLLCVILFDADDLDAAFAELDERFVAGEGAPFAGHLAVGVAQRRAINASDWSAYRDLLAPDIVLVDHRPVGLGSLRGPDEVVRATQTLFELSQGARTKIVTVHRIADDASLVQSMATATTNDGGAIENRQLRISQTRDGLLVRTELFPVEQLDAALVRFDELADQRPSSLENEAFRALERGEGHAMRGDWAAVAAELTDDAVFEDRRRGFGWRFEGKEAVLEQISTGSPKGMTYEEVPIATRGERLVLTRQLVRVAGFEVENLVVYEIDDNALGTGCVFFDTDDVDAAFAELDGRYAAGEGASFADFIHMGTMAMAAFNSGDWDAYAALFSPDVVFVDHGLASAGELSGRESLVAYARTIHDVATNHRERIVAYHVLDQHGGVAEIRARGENAEGGLVEFAMVYVGVIESGRVARFEMFPTEQLASALARFDELRAPVETLENACALLMRDICGAALERRWDDLAADLAEDVVGEDRRSGLRGRATGREETIETLRVIAELGASSVDLATIAIRGDRLALLRLVISGSEADVGASEVAVVGVYELNERGQLERAVTFDTDDLDAAFDELDRRFVQGEGRNYREVIELERLANRTYNERDWDAHKALVHEDFELVDHNVIGAGTISGHQEFVDYRRPLAELAPDIKVHTVEYLGLAKDRMLAHLRSHGRTPDGSEVVHEYLSTGVFRDGRLINSEKWAPEDRDAAWARWQELLETQD